MQTRIRDVRRAMRLTLAEVAARCEPQTTAQTIGRLETGMRTVSVAWLNRIAHALNVDPSDLVTKSDRQDVSVVAMLTAHGIEAPRRAMVLASPQPRQQMVGLLVEASLGDYRSGDQLWLERLEGADMAQGLNRDCLLPLADGTLAFGRLVTVEQTQGFSMLPLGLGDRLISGLRPHWLAAAQLLVRQLASA